MERMFRFLRADEVECRVSTVKENGISLLLYKDARCDQNILDETVGPKNWMRHHSRENANCTVSIWDDEKRIWIEKEDTGTESNTEKEKGLASDSFKRACFNWGIGRELYTAPFIWIPADKCKIVTGSNGKPTCYDRFRVKTMTVRDGNITSLQIAGKNGVVYAFGNVAREEELADLQSDREADREAEKEAEAVANSPIDAVKITTIKKVIAKKGLSPNSILQHYKHTSFEEMTLKEFMDAMNLLNRYPDKR